MAPDAAAEGAAGLMAEVMTELSLENLEGIPDGSIISIRAGGSRRQKPKNRCKDPFSFKGPVSAIWPVQVDILAPHATTGNLGVLSPGEQTLSFSPTGAATPGPSEMRAKLVVTERGGGGDSIAKSPDTSSVAQTYMEEHLLKDRLTHVLMHLLREQPEDPISFLSTALGDLPVLAEKQSRPSTAERVDKEVTKLDLARAIQGDPVHMRDSLYIMPPCVTRGVPTWLLDFGSGETGFHTYDFNEDAKCLKYFGQKRKEPLFQSFVEPNRVDEFCQLVIDEFSLKDSGGKKTTELSIFAGATGLHRELLADTESAQKARKFFEAAEEKLSSTLGKRTTIRLFVPSGLLEAQLELIATEWLVGRQQVLDLGEMQSEENKAISDQLVQEAFDKLDHSGTGSLSADDLSVLMSRTAQTERGSGVVSAVSELVSSKAQVDFNVFQESLAGNQSLQLAVQSVVFSGTISAGGGSSQLSMMNSNSGGTLQLFSVPVGNRVPIVEGLFSKPVRPEEREIWAARVRTELEKASFPTGVRGLYVGISAVYHAVKLAGAAERVVSLEIVRAALAAKIEESDPAEQRDIANLILVHELLGWMFDRSTCFIFKRDWTIPDGRFVATWTLGLFTQQHRTLMSEVSPSHARHASPPKMTSSNSVNSSRRRSEAMFEVPFVACPLTPTHLLDIGSGEVGVYTYTADVVNSTVCSTLAQKINKPFFEGFVAEDHVDDFATMLMQEFGFATEGQQYPAQLVIAGGATGLHREMLLGHQDKRDQIYGFIGRVEAEIAKRLGQDVCIRIFVPSGELEAQFELRAVEWLIGLPGIDIQSGVLQPWMMDETWSMLNLSQSDSVKVAQEAGAGCAVEIKSAQTRLKALGVRSEEVMDALRRADSDGGGSLDRNEFCKSVEIGSALECLVRRCTFGGTISAGGGSCQLTLTGLSRKNSAQLYSMPLGNRVPIVQKLFTDPVTWDQRTDWVSRIRNSLHTNRFPRKCVGLYVGISAMYHAAKMAGIADRIVTTPEAVAALAVALDKVDLADHRSIANLTLCKTVIDWAFDDAKSCLLFKRNWKSSTSNYVAGWVLGWYVTQFEDYVESAGRSAVTIQRVTRGWQTRNRLQQAQED